MRTPIRLLRELGFFGFATFQLVVGGNVLAALIHPFFLAGVFWAAATGAPIVGRNGAPLALFWLFSASWGAGYLISAYLGVRGLIRRGVTSTAWVLAALPVHWLMLSFAAWRALLQLAYDPHGWEKTEHGLAQSSRLAEMADRPAAPARHDFDERRPPVRHAA